MKGSASASVSEAQTRYFRYNRPKRAGSMSNAGDSHSKTGLLGAAFSQAAEVEQVEVKGAIWLVREIVRAQRMPIAAGTAELKKDAFRRQAAAVTCGRTDAGGVRRGATEQRLKDWNEYGQW